MFIDEWFGDNFYKKLPLGYHNPANFRFGQVFSVVVDATSVSRGRAAWYPSRAKRMELG